MIDLGQLFTDLGIAGGNTQSHTQYDFYKGVIWNDADVTYNQYEFFKKVDDSRYAFFKPYPNETQFYKDIDDDRIYDYDTFYKYAAEYFAGGVPPVNNWILDTGNWNDSGVWVDTDVWID